MLGVDNFSSTEASLAESEQDFTTKLTWEPSSHISEIWYPVIKRRLIAIFNHTGHRNKSEKRGDIADRVAKMIYGKALQVKETGNSK